MGSGTGSQRGGICYTTICKIQVYVIQLVLSTQISHKQIVIYHIT